MPVAQGPRTNYQYAAPPRNKQGATAVFGWILLVMGIIALIGSLSSPIDVSTVMTSLILFCGGGAALIWLGNKNKRRHSMYTKYSSIIAGNPNASLEQIAATSGRPYAKVCSDLQKLVDTGFFPGYYLDQNRKAFSCPAAQSARPASPTPFHASSLTPTPVPSAPKVVKCPGCGGVNNVVGAKNECEYCGSPLE